MYLSHNVSSTVFFTDILPMKDTWLRYMHSIYLEDEIRFVSKNIQSNSFVIEQENQINSQLNMFELIKENSQYGVSQEPEIQTTVKERLRYNTEMP